MEKWNVFRVADFKPHELTAEDKSKRKVACLAVLRDQRNGNILDRIVICDEKYVYYNNASHKEEWLAPEELAGSVSRRTLTKKKLLLCIWHLRFSRSTVSRAYQGYMDGRQKLSYWENCKGQLALTLRGERRLRRIIRSQRSQTLAHITTKLSDGVSRTSSTYESNIDQCSPSIYTSGLDIEDRKRVAWSDESRFRLLNAGGRLSIWGQAHEVIGPACRLELHKEHSGSIMVWGVFSWHCLGPLVRVPASRHAIRYVELLRDHLYSNMLLCYRLGNGVFQQENFTSHKSKLATG
ncbi:HTH_Tnp_Tc3_2 domain-containing protein [Trichonephila clavipes]|nr:HTH_Tnp_Tc3_2 domain-containing protein [Trichonephila clavipes]